MPTIEVREILSREEKLELLDRLERIGSAKLMEELEQTLLGGIHPEYRNNTEFLLRYLLLAAVLDQQADSESARKTVRELYLNYGPDLFMSPEKHFDKINEVVEKALKTYEPKVRVLRMKKVGITLLRIGGYLTAINNLSLRYGGLSSYFKRFLNPRNLLERGILGETMLTGLLYEKAARLYVGWVTHPDLPIKLYGDRILKSEIPMVVDGHVAKIMARTGFLGKVRIEDPNNKIIEAERERKNIEEACKDIKPFGDLFAIDYGAFHIGINYCNERSPSCERCPLNNLCRKNIEIRAF
ncbi:MAG: hypothetical protein GU347_03475 [Desulfurococcales archaeon]|jgi:hypothetical protein|nr:hypothetical protein [Desulfurococcales archaeon]